MLEGWIMGSKQAEDKWGKEAEGIGCGGKGWGGLMRVCVEVYNEMGRSVSPTDTRPQTPTVLDATLHVTDCDLLSK